jgi:hypothetical protein
MCVRPQRLCVCSFNSPSGMSGCRAPSVPARRGSLKPCPVSALETKANKSGLRALLPERLSLLLQAFHGYPQTRHHVTAAHTRGRPLISYLSTSFSSSLRALCVNHLGSLSKHGLPTPYRAGQFNCPGWELKVPRACAMQSSTVLHGPPLSGLLAPGEAPEGAHGLPRCTSVFFC